MREDTSYEKRTGEHCIDSDGMLAVAYHTRRLILRGFNALLYSRVYQMHKRFLRRVANSHTHKRWISKGMKGFILNKKYQSKRRMLCLMKDTLLLRKTGHFFGFWLNSYRRHKAETTIVSAFHS